MSPLTLDDLLSLKEKEVVKYLKSLVVKMLKSPALEQKTLNETVLANVTNIYISGVSAAIVLIEATNRDIHHQVFNDKAMLLKFSKAGKAVAENYCRAVIRLSTTISSLALYEPSGRMDVCFDDCNNETIRGLVEQLVVIGDVLYQKRSFNEMALEHGVSLEMLTRMTDA